VRACICVIANALYARKMIAILPPRGTYAAAVDGARRTVCGGGIGGGGCGGGFPWSEWVVRREYTRFSGRVHIAAKSRPRPAALAQKAHSHLCAKTWGVCACVSMSVCFAYAYKQPRR